MYFLGFYRLWDNGCSTRSRMREAVNDESALFKFQQSTFQLVMDNRPLKNVLFFVCLLHSLIESWKFLENSGWRKITLFQDKHKYIKCLERNNPEETLRISHNQIGCIHLGFATINLSKTNLAGSDLVYWVLSSQWINFERKDAITFYGINGLLFFWGVIRSCWKSNRFFFSLRNKMVISCIHVDLS